MGTIMFMPLVYPFEPWRIKHNVHHAHTNKCARVRVVRGAGLGWDIRRRACSLPCRAPTCLCAATRGTPSLRPIPAPCLTHPPPPPAQAG